MKRRPSIMLKAPRRPDAPSGRIRVSTGAYQYASPDAFKQKRAPSPAELVQAHRNATYACAMINCAAVASQPFRQYVTTNTGKGQPKARVKTKALTRRQERYLESDPLHLKRLQAVDKVEEVTESPILELYSRVNPYLNQFQLLELTQLYRELVGYDFWFKVLGVGNRPVEIWPLPAWMCRPIPDYSGTGVIQEFAFTGGGGQATLTPDQVLFGRELSPIDPYVGSLSWVRAGYDLTQIFDKQVDYRDATLTNRGRPDAMLIPKEEGGELNDPVAMSRIKAEYEQQYALGRAGKLYIPPGGTVLQPLSWSPQDMGEIAMSKSTLADICRMAGVPPALMDGTAASRANLDAALLQHARFAVKPRVRRLEEHWNSDFIPLWDDSGRTFLAFDDPVPADAVREQAEAVADIQWGIRTFNEVRAGKGLEPVEGGDVLLVKTGYTPIETAVNPPDPVTANPGGDGPKPDEVPGDDDGDADPEAEADDPEGEDDPEFEEGQDVESDKASKSREGDDRRPFGASGLRTKESPDRGTEGGGQGGGEENTYGLPQGEPIRRALVKWFGMQQKAVLGTLQSLGATVPLTLSVRADWTDRMASAMVPLIGAYWNESGRKTNARLGLDPDDWNVRRPELAGKIRSAALAFCDSTNATTSMQLNHALEATRAALLDGGGSMESLTDKVNAIYATATRSKARQIAASEASRAVHAAQEEAAIRSGVVQGFELLLSGDACPLCRKVATECKNVRIGQPFAVIGTNPHYAAIKHPPIHPGCQCALSEILTPDMGGPEHVDFGTTLQQPQKELGEKPEAKPIPEPRPVKPKPVRVDHPNPVVHPTPQPVMPPPAAVAVTPKPEPVKPAEPQPRGKPVAAALDVKAAGAVGDKVREAIAAIGRVHGDGNLPVIPVEEMTKGTADGLFRRTWANQPIDIQIGRRGNDQKFTAAHEIGHFLEKSAIGGTTTVSGGRDWATDPVFKEWHAAVMKSESVKQIRETAAKSTVVVRNPYDGSESRVKVPKSAANYLLEPEELWARSYAQYIARKSGDRDMLDSADRDMKASSYARLKMPPQWHDDDFKAIESEIDRIFAKQGWRS